MKINFDCNQTLNSLFSCTSLDAWMLTSTVARVELLVCLATARPFICAHCVQSADLQVCFPTSFAASLPNDLSSEGPAAVGVALRIRRTPFKGSRAGWILSEASCIICIQIGEAPPCADPCQKATSTTKTDSPIVFHPSFRTEHASKFDPKIKTFFESSPRCRFE